MSNIDWKLLRLQKAELLSMANDPDRRASEGATLDGVIGLLDFIQDEAVRTGDATEAEVFGTEFAQSAEEPDWIEP